MEWVTTRAGFAPIVIAMNKEKGNTYPVDLKGIVEFVVFLTEDAQLQFEQVVPNFLLDAFYVLQHSRLASFVRKQVDEACGVDCDVMGDNVAPQAQ